MTEQQHDANYCLPVLLRLCIVYERTRVDLGTILLSCRICEPRWSNNFKTTSFKETIVEEMNSICMNSKLEIIQHEMEHHFVQYMLHEQNAQQVKLVSTVGQQLELQQPTLNLLLKLNSQGFIPPLPQLQSNQFDQWESLKFIIISQYKLLLHLEQLLCRPESSFGFDKRTPRIPFQHFVHSQSILSKEYDCNVLWVPGFYTRHGLPMFSGACSYDTSIGTFIQLHSSLKESEKFFSLDRVELLIHELAHSARTPLHSLQFEEEFAYRLSKSYFRRIFSPIVQRSTDSIIFSLVGALSMLTDIPGFFSSFWRVLSKAPVVVTIVFGLVRLFHTKRILTRAAATLHKVGIPMNHVQPILFRMSDDEILKLASPQTSTKGSNITQWFKDWVYNQSQCDLRWKVILHAYCSSLFLHAKL